MLARGAPLKPKSSASAPTSTSAPGSFLLSAVRVESCRALRSRPRACAACASRSVWERATAMRVFCSATLMPSVRTDLPSDGATPSKTSRASSMAARLRVGSVARSLTAVSSEPTI